MSKIVRQMSKVISISTLQIGDDNLITKMLKQFPVLDFRKLDSQQSESGKVQLFMCGFGR